LGYVNGQADLLLVLGARTGHGRSTATRGVSTPAIVRRHVIAALLVLTQARGVAAAAVVSAAVGSGLVPGRPSCVGHPRDPRRRLRLRSAPCSTRTTSAPRWSSLGGPRPAGAGSWRLAALVAGWSGRSPVVRAGDLTAVSTASARLSGPWGGHGTSGARPRRAGDGRRVQWLRSPLESIANYHAFVPPRLDAGRLCFSPGEQPVRLARRRPLVSATTPFEAVGVGRGYEPIY